MGTSPGARWDAHPWLARILRAVRIIGPAVVGFVVAWIVAGMLPEPEGFGETFGWLVLLIAVTLLAVVATQRLARRLLPLSWLLTLTLVFPDRAPSRLQTARRAASRRGRERALADARAGMLATNEADAPQAALVLVAALSAHDRRTRGHSERVRTLADVLAEEAGVSSEDRSRLRWGALLHDIGKLLVPGEILNKPGRPDEAEWATLQRHPEEGRRLVAPLVTWLGPWAGAVGDHHEKWDGSGYPRGVAGEDISLGGRILAVADSYEVMTATRSYKKPSSPIAARKELVASAGTHFDPTLVRAFLGISLGKLWWIAGSAAVLAQIPVLGRLWATPGASRAKDAGAGPAVAAGALAVAAMTGVVSTGDDTPISASRPAAVATPAPAPAEPPAPPAVPPPEPIVAPAGAATIPLSSPTVKPVAGPAQPAPPTSSPPVTPAVVAPPADAPGATPAPSSPSAPPGTTPAPPRRELFTGSGQTVAPSFLSTAGLGLTELGFRLLCSAPPLTQGIDAVVFDLPDAARAEPATVAVTGDVGTVEVAFFSADCRELGRTEIVSGENELPLTAGARYVVVSPRSPEGNQIGIVVRAAA